MKQLRTRFSSLCFTICHIDPVAADEKIPPGSRMHNQLYEFLEYTGKKDDGINFIGNYVSIDKDSELFSVLAGWGIHNVRQIFNCKTFEEYSQLADSRLNLVLMRMGKLAAQNMEQKLDIPYFYNPISYDIDEVVRNYHSIAGLLGRECPDFNSETAQTWRAVQETKEHIGDMPIIVDSSAAMRPFALARALYGYGFNVRTVFAPHMKDVERDDRKWLDENCPHISIVLKGSYEAIIGYGFDQECIAVGFDSAYMLRAHHFVDMRRDESFYGFHGIQKFMRLIREACDTQANW